MVEGLRMDRAYYKELIKEKHSEYRLEQAEWNQERRSGLYREHLIYG